MMQLVLNTYGMSLKRKAERFVVRLPDRPTPIEIAASKIQSIVVASSIHLTSSAIELATQHNIHTTYHKFVSPCQRRTANAFIEHVVWLDVQMQPAFFVHVLQGQGE